MRAAIAAILIGGATAAAPQGEQAAEPAAAPPPPAGPICAARIEGQVSCQANRLCECEFAPAVPARGLPARWRWDCSIKRPECVVTPESLAPHDHHGPVPAIVDVERDDHGDDDGDDPG